MSVSKGYHEVTIQATIRLRFKQRRLMFSSVEGQGLPLGTGTGVVA
jgi:hypothetical protein